MSAISTRATPTEAAFAPRSPRATATGHHKARRCIGAHGPDHPWNHWWTVRAPLSRRAPRARSPASGGGGHGWRHKAAPGRRLAPHGRSSLPFTPNHTLTAGPIRPDPRRLLVLSSRPAVAGSAQHSGRGARRGSQGVADPVDEKCHLVADLADVAAARGQDRERRTVRNGHQEQEAVVHLDDVLEH